MDSALLKMLYGTDDGNAILRSKCSEKQIRAQSNGKSGTAVGMTPDECRKLCKAAGGIEYLDGYEMRVLQYRITDESVDRYGDIVRAKGVRLDNYKKNPVVQFAHNYEEPPVGVSLKTWYDKETNSVWAWPLFMDDRHDTSGRSELVFRLARANIMRACSIGFNPLDVYQPGNADEREKLGLGEYGVEFKKCDLMEFSPVAVPANPNALQDTYREEFVRGLKAAGLARGHLDTLRRYPVLADNAIDALIAEFDAAKVAIVVNSDSANTASAAMSDTYIAAKGATTMTVSSDTTTQATEPQTDTETAARAATVNVHLDCGDVAASIAQLQAVVAETKQVCDTLVTELREMVSTVRGALADPTRAAPKPATNINLYDNVLKLNR